MIRINLLKPGKKELKDVKLPKEAAALPKEKFKEKKKTDPAKLIVLVSFVLVAFLFLTQRNAINKEKRLLENATEEKNKLIYVFSKLEQLEEQKALYEKKITLIRQLKSRQEVPVRIIDELSKNLPDWVWLTQATYEKQRVRLKGKALSNNLIADYISNLEESPYFSAVNLIASVQKRIKNDIIQEFSLTARCIYPQSATPLKESLNKNASRKNK